jgi:hypothetical protein
MDIVDKACAQVKRQTGQPIRGECRMALIKLHL